MKYTYENVSLLTFFKTPDIPAAFFHFQKAAHGGCVEACLALANIHKPYQTVLQGLTQPLENVELKYKVVTKKFILLFSIYK